VVAPKDLYHLLLLNLATRSWGYFSLAAFRAWQVRRLLADANALVSEGNYNHASLDARRVLELDPQNADAMRVIARSADVLVCGARLSFGEE